MIYTFCFLFISGTFMYPMDPERIHKQAMAMHTSYSILFRFRYTHGLHGLRTKPQANNGEIYVSFTMIDAIYFFVHVRYPHVPCGLRKETQANNGEIHILFTVIYTFYFLLNSGTPMYLHGHRKDPQASNRDAYILFLFLSGTLMYLTDSEHSHKRTTVIYTFHLHGFKNLIFCSFQVPPCTPWDPKGSTSEQR